MSTLLALALALLCGPAQESGERPAWLDDVQDWDTPQDDGDDDLDDGDDNLDDGDDRHGGERPDDKHEATTNAVGLDAHPRAAPKPKRTDTVTGSFRIVGSFLRQRADARTQGAKDDALLAVVGRVIVRDEWASGVDAELNVFIDLSRAPDALGGTFATAGSFRTPYRASALTFDLWQRDSITGITGIDRARLALGSDALSVEIGRFPINNSVTQIFTPNDVFAPFSATSINRAFKPGVDAVRVSGVLGSRGSIEASAVLGSNDRALPAWAYSAVLVRPSIVAWGFEWSALAGKVAQRWLVGGALQGDLGRIGVRAEGHIGLPDRDGNGLDRREAIHGRLAAGPNLNFAWRGATVGIEYGYFSDGGDHPSRYATRFAQRFPDDLPYLAQHYVGANGGLELSALLRAQLVALTNATDGSGIAGAFFSYSLADEADLSFGTYVPWGHRRSHEFGRSPALVFLEVRAFF